MSRAVASVLAFSLLFQGCALIVRGTTEPVAISGAQLEVDGRAEDPGTIELRRRQVHVVSGVVGGRRETRIIESDLSPGWFALDLVVFGLVLAPIGSVAFLVDLATGSLNSFDPTSVAFAETAAPGPKAATCAACRTPFGEGAKFCAECGARR